MKFRRSTALFVLTLVAGLLFEGADLKVGPYQATAFNVASGFSRTLHAQQPSERDFLSRIRRLTIEGRRAGEGYWSPDGSRLVF